MFHSFVTVYITVSFWAEGFQIIGGLHPISPGGLVPRWAQRFQILGGLHSIFPGGLGIKGVTSPGAEGRQ